MECMCTTIPFILTASVDFHFCRWDPPGRSSWGRLLICSVDKLDVNSTQFLSDAKMLKGDVPGNLVPNLQPMWLCVKVHMTFVD